MPISQTGRRDSPRRKRASTNPSAAKLWAVIMAGGSGTRFWPVSRAKIPKQFLDLFGSQTLLEQTVNRLKPLVPSKRLLVVTQKRNVPKVRHLLNLPNAQIVGEPVGRNTAPCAVLAAALILKKDPSAALAILPSDHYVGKTKIFKKALALAAQTASREHCPVTFGIAPTFPHTGYGYLELEKKYTKRDLNSIFRLRGFHEKPSPAKARAFLKSRRFLWNSGIFVWRADQLLEAARKFLPQAYELAQRIAGPHFTARMKSHYASMPDISIDYGLMEKVSGKILAIPVEMQWHDLGGWQAFWKLSSKDPQDNVGHGQTLFIESRGNVVKSSSHKLVALLGVHDFVIADTPDALLVCPKEKTESLRGLVRRLKEKKLEKYL